MRRIFTCVVFLAFAISSFSQAAPDTCDLSCNDLVHIALDATCERTLIPADVAQGDHTQPCFAGLTLMVMDPYGVPIPNNLLTEKYMGKQLTYKVIDPLTNNTCWGYVLVEDKFPPTLLTPDSVISCFDPIPEVPDGVEGCGFALLTKVIHTRFDVYGCDENPRFVGELTRVVHTEDLWGNFVRDTQVISIERADLDTLICPPDTAIDCCVGDINFGPDSVFTDYKLWNDHYVWYDDEGYAHPKPIVDPVTKKSVGLVAPPAVVINGDTIYLMQNNDHCNIVVKYSDWVVPVCGASYKIRREWKIKDWCSGIERLCTQWIKIKDEDAPVVFYSKDFPPLIEAVTQVHECKAHIELSWPTIYNDCVIKSNKTDPEAALKSMKVHYEFDYPDPSHPGKRVHQYGEIEYGKKVNVYIPKSGLFFTRPHIQVKYTVSDPCENFTQICQTILVFDNEPPNPVCDEITQVTLDPESCWARLYANDLDDGSHDNCDDVHFAVAKMSDIEYWQSYWYEQLAGCLDPYEYDHFKGTIHDLINEWIDLYVFDTYLDLTECGTDSLVLRVYEDLKTPPYDPHVFRGSEHQWFNWYRAPVMRYGGYRCNYVYYYDSLNQYKKFYPPIHCGDIHLAYTIELIEDFLVEVLGAVTAFDFDRLDMTIEQIFQVNSGLDQLDDLLAYLGRQICDNPLDNIFDEGILCFNLEGILENIAPIDLGIDVTLNATNGTVTIIPNGAQPLVGTILAAPSGNTANIQVTNVLQLINLLGYLICFEDDLQKKQQIYNNIAYYPELASFVSLDRNLIHFLYSGVLTKRFHDFPYYNDCMIEVIKDDKTPPVCNAPNDVTAYCDGVPYASYLTLGDEKISWWGAGYAHDICAKSDTLTSPCDFDKSGKQRADIIVGYGHGGYDNFCVSVPWDGGDHGYYGGPQVDHYNYPLCDTRIWGVDGMVHEGDWRPIYCRVWLLLDMYDDPSYGKPNPEKYFGTPEYYDNCWYPTIDSTTEGSLNECGVGVFTRTWTVTDKCENESVCYQRVIIKPRSDFEVVFPEDVVVICDDDNNLSPDRTGTGAPIITDDECELVGISSSDQLLEITSDGCYKILRTWKIIDWCVFDPDVHFRHPDVIVDDRIYAGEDRPCVYRNLKDDGDGYMEYVQVIKVVDREKPEIICISPVVLCDYSENCVPEDVDIDFGDATDNCTPTEELAFRYVIIPEGAADESDYIYGHGKRFTGQLPFGIHDVELTVSDRCGNEASCTTQIALNDCKLPTPYCYEGVATVIMPNSGTVEVWASDLDAGSFDNCTAKEDLYFSFDALGVEPSRIFSCEDIPDGVSNKIEVEIYVWDEGGNADKCVTYILLQDGSGDVCEEDRSNQVVETTSHHVNVVNIQSQRAEMTAQSGSAIEALSLRNKDTEDYILYQNRPNPFADRTQIQFYLPENTNIKLTVFNIAGKKLTGTEGNFNKGLHQYEIQSNQLENSSGVIYYQLKTENFVATKKMILLN